jgi:hypothetical protein
LWKEQHTTLSDHDPNTEQGNGEEVVEEGERLAGDAGEEADRSVNTVTAELEVSETAELEGFELGV